MLPPVKRSIPCFPFHIKIHQHVCLELFQTVFTWSVLISLLIQTRQLSLDKVILWIEDMFQSETILSLKNVCLSQTCSFSLHKTLFDRPVMDYCDVFIRCLNSHSDGTHSLQKIHCWASNVMLNFSNSASINKLISILNGLRVRRLLANVHFWVSYSFKHHFVCLL